MTFDSSPTYDSSATYDSGGSYSPPTVVPVTLGTPTGDGYPTNVRSFTTWVDQPGGPGQTALTIDRAHIINDLQTEVAALEVALGSAPYIGLPYQVLASILNDLYNYKAPLLHVHSHTLIYGDAPTNDHDTQYLRVDANSTVTAPLTGQPAVLPDQLLTLGQVQSVSSVSTSGVSAALAAALPPTSSIKGATDAALMAIPGNAYAQESVVNLDTLGFAVRGGVFSGLPNAGSGQMQVNFTNPFSQALYWVGFCRLPYLGAPFGSYPAWNYGSEPISFFNGDRTGFSMIYGVNANHDTHNLLASGVAATTATSQKLVSFCWIAFGV
jgi:hypothetical protein